MIQKMGVANFLITGPPGCGKTTFLIKIIEEMRIPATGFFTREVRERGRRVGFRLRTLDGKEDWLAHVRIGGPHRVGRYGVSLEALEDVGVASLRPVCPRQLVVVDEIGKMECLSTAFCEAISAILDGPFPLLGTIAETGRGFMEEIRNRHDVQLFRLDPSTRDRLRCRLLTYVNREKGH